MCRHLAYLGPPQPLSRLLFDPPHSLVHQSWAPREMRGSGTINADGFGVGWYPGPAGGFPGPAGELPDPAGELPDPASEPIRYRREYPIWTDVDLPGLAAHTAAGAVLAAVRSASAGMPLSVAACAPFAGHGRLFSLNGRIAGWPESVAPLAEQLPVAELLALPQVDSAVLWALLRHRLAGGAEPVAAVSTVVAEVFAVAPGSRLNLLLADRQQILATTGGHSLSVRHDGGSVLVSSEPLDDDPAWRPIPDGMLAVATRTGVDLAPLPLTGLES